MDEEGGGVGEPTSADRYKSEENSKGGVRYQRGRGSATQLSSTRSEFKGQF